MGHYFDGKQDCQNSRCSLYTWMPYREKEPDLGWAEFSPRKIGLVRWDDITPPANSFPKRLSDQAASHGSQNRNDKES